MAYSIICVYVTCTDCGRELVPDPLGGLMCPSGKHARGYVHPR